MKQHQRSVTLSFVIKVMESRQNNKQKAIDTWV